MKNITILVKSIKTKLNNIEGKELSFYSNRGDYISGFMFMPKDKFNYSDVIIGYDDNSETNSSKKIEDYIYTIAKNNNLLIYQQTKTEKQ